MLFRHACHILLRLRCNKHSILLNSYLSSIEKMDNLRAVRGVIRLRTLLICTVQLRSQHR